MYLKQQGHLTRNGIKNMYIRIFHKKCAKFTKLRYLITLISFENNNFI